MSKWNKLVDQASAAGIASFDVNKVLVEITVILCLHSEELAVVFTIPLSIILQSPLCIGALARISYI